MRSSSATCSRMTFSAHSDLSMLWKAISIGTCMGHRSKLLVHVNVQGGGLVQAMLPCNAVSASAGPGVGCAVILGRIVMLKQLGLCAVLAVALAVPVAAQQAP